MSYFHELQTALAGIDPSPLLGFVRACQGTLWIAGNGGSAAIAQHLACDLSKAAGRRAQALGSNLAVLTAWANDESYGAALARDLERLAQPGDRLICLSCSGTSPNILRVIDRAAIDGMPTALVSGRRYHDTWSTLVVTVPHTDYGILEDCFSAIGHWLTKELA